MKNIIPILSLAVAVMLVPGCKSPDSRRPMTITNLGRPNKRQITVYVGGEVKRPAKFMLLEGATVKDALNAAGGLNDFNVWKRSSLRRADGTVVKFRKSNQTQDEQLLLHNGDIVNIGRVIY